MKKLTILISIFLSMALHATTSKTVNVSIAGTLSSYFTTAEDSAVTNLTITGTIDARDFKFIRNLFYLTNINIENANIDAYEGKEGTMSVFSSYYDSTYSYPANELPDYSLYEMYFLESILLPKTIISIGKNSLSCEAGPGSLDSLNIPEGVTSIGNYCGNGQDNIKTLRLPSTLESIGNKSFRWIVGLSVLTNLNPTPIIIDSTCFQYVEKSACTLYVPYGSGDAYRSADVWKEFNVIELSEETTAINQTTTDNTKKTVISYYSITGMKLSNEPESGIYIVVYSNGESEKRMKNDNLTKQ